MPDLFVYGTLRFPEVLDALLGRTPRLSQASADGWKVAALPGVAYPGMVRAEGIAQGLVVEGLTEGELEILHAYEDDDYTVETVDLTDGRRALAYVWRHETLSDVWDPEAFDVAAWVPVCAAFRDEYLRNSPAR
ncbi:gamma-glutamylcyclotransferase family protein [Actinocorallia sp. A-T 12471]|uniref:gamma-glutamylcyclotransferase family protein n=1 Tax=Actinocorallia sp. A-T 12471 TaxID=3089813 RepID=UPI0029CD138E|nr:gamma-glutamylcyclotransferase family protein [Actinocorallia sp. A-T 12471]MDX6741917.1 gamma-glutamylcyclotransferase family protein [Actinocorallia sp. A-T 12471]